MTGPRRLVVGVSGATGTVYAVRLLEWARKVEIETHLVVTRAADMTRAQETDITARDFRELADVSYRIGDVGAPVASGSFSTMGMVVVPCSARSMAAIAYGVDDTLLARAAEVTLKEGRRLVLAVRETPWSATQCRAALAASEAGAIIAPPVPAMYTRPETITDIVDHTVGRLLDLFGVDTGMARWGENRCGSR